MDEKETAELEKMSPGELALEYENSVIDLLGGVSGASLERIREIRRIVVRQLKYADQARGALT